MVLLAQGESSIAQKERCASSSVEAQVLSSPELRENYGFREAPLIRATAEGVKAAVGRKACGKEFEGDLSSWWLCSMLKARAGDLGPFPVRSDTHALGAVDVDEAASCLSRGRRRTLFLPSKTVPLEEGRVRVERFERDVAAIPGTPPLRLDDTADIVTLLAMVVKLQTGIDEVGRQRQHWLHEEFVPCTVEKLANSRAIANRTWTTWSQWPTQETPHGWVSLQTHDVAVEVLDWTGSIGGGEHSEAIGVVPISRRASRARIERAGGCC